MGMETLKQSQSVPLKDRLAHKLHPVRYPRMSGTLAAILGFLLDTSFTDPRIAEIVVTFDGFVLARAPGEVCANRFVGSYSDLIRNWLGLLACAGLSQTEVVEAESLFAERIGYFGRTSA
jgi:hypothetical protein